MEPTLNQIHQLIRQALSEQVRIGSGIDFHSLYDECPLVLAGVTIPHHKGFRVKRSDGDVISHALVDALLSATGKGDIADWFKDTDNVTNARSIDYLGMIHEKVLSPLNIKIIQVLIHILAEEPKLKPFFSQMQQEIAKQLKLDANVISIQGKTFEGKGIIGSTEGIAAQVFILVLKQN